VQRGRPVAEWQKNLLTLKSRKSNEISLSQLESITKINRRHLSQSLSRMIQSTRKETFYNTQDLYEVIKNKLRGY
jgi:hypothetical protein